MIPIYSTTADVYLCGGHWSQQSMLIYLFKNPKGEIIETNELTAHNIIRNKNELSHQGMTYLGAIDDREVIKYAKEAKDIATESALNENPKIKRLKDEIKLAGLNKDESLAQKKELELSIETSEFLSKVSKRDYDPNDEIDSIRIKIQNTQNKLVKEKMESLEANKTILPRNFKSLTSGFNGEESFIQDKLDIS